jgi:hypothetical protein
MGVSVAVRRNEFRHGYAGLRCKLNTTVELTSTEQVDYPSGRRMVGVKSLLHPFDPFWLVTPTGNWADKWRSPAFGAQARSKGDGSDAHAQYLRLSYTQPDRST